MDINTVRETKKGGQHASSRLPPAPAAYPLMVEKDAKNFLVIALTDIDGTIVNENVPEAERIASIRPALEPARALERDHSIPVGIITGRSFGEAKFYRDKLGGTGPLICENGAVIAIPGHLPEAAAAARARGFTAFQLPSELLVIPSRVRAGELVSALTNTSERYRRVNGEPAGPPTTSLSSVDHLAERLQFATLDDAARSAERVASIFVLFRTPEERDFFEDALKDSPLQISGHDLPHILPRDCNKGAALRVLSELMSASGPGNTPISGVVPIAFGNASNDIPSLDAAEKLGGKGVLVARPEGGYAVDPQLLPDSVIRSIASAGRGISEALPQVLEWLHNSYNLRSAPKPA